MARFNQGIKSQQRRKRIGNRCAFFSPFMPIFKPKLSATVCHLPFCKIFEWILGWVRGKMKKIKLFVK